MSHCTGLVIPDSWWSQIACPFSTPFIFCTAQGPLPSLRYYSLHTLATAWQEMEPGHASPGQQFWPGQVIGQFFRPVFFTVAPFLHSNTILTHGCVVETFLRRWFVCTGWPLVWKTLKCDRSFTDVMDFRNNLGILSGKKNLVRENCFKTCLKIALASFLVSLTPCALC